MERRQLEIIEEQRRLFRDELEAKTKYQNIDHDLAELIKKVDINALRNFLARFEQNARRAWVDPGYREVSEIGDEENLRNIREAFKKI